jgi:hypothetical protein
MRFCWADYVTRFIVASKSHRKNQWKVFGIFRSIFEETGCKGAIRCAMNCHRSEDLWKKFTRNVLNERSLEIRVMIPDGGGTRTFKTSAFLQTVPAGTHTEKQIYAYRQTCQTSHNRRCWPSFFSLNSVFWKKNITGSWDRLVICVSVCPLLKKPE